MLRRLLILPTWTILVLCLAKPVSCNTSSISIDKVKAGFLSPPVTARPGVYWYFMDGNLSRDGITADLESMKNAGIGHVVFLEVNVGVPRGKVDMLSDEWLDIFAHAVRECERLGIEMTLGIGPGWAGSGGPWVKPEDSMQHLVSTTTLVSGPGKQRLQLPTPDPKKPFFGDGVFTPELKREWLDYYRDVAVLAYPQPEDGGGIADVDEKALYYRAPYTSMKSVKPWLPEPSGSDGEKPGNAIAKDKIVDLTESLKADGSLEWDVPPGKWVIARFGARNNGAITRPAPQPGLGFEADKFSTSAIQSHLDKYVGRLLDRVGERSKTSAGGLKALHIDSWEMGAQNWTPEFRQEFIRRRGYDPLPYYPVTMGNIVENLGTSERFLWDLRLTSQELIVENHAGYVKKYAHDLGLKLSIEPYDMNPTSDLELGGVADIPMCEFWSKGYGFNSAFSCIEAVSIAHVNGSAVVQAEAFTGDPDEAWRQYPGSMKDQGDWAFAAGINRFFYHTFQHQPLSPELKPGMAMGPYGVHWDRNQTFWPMVDTYHDYISRCQSVLQQGRTVADILYLTSEGAPHVFNPPVSALEGESIIADRKGYNFDGCSPSRLYGAKVINGKIIFASGAEYGVLCLSKQETMTPELLEKVASLVNDGAMVVGELPNRSPSLSGQPVADERVAKLAGSLGDKVVKPVGNDNYPGYSQVAGLLKDRGVSEDFITTGPIRYTHRTSPDWDIYFVSNRTTGSVQTDCSFRVSKAVPQLWNPISGTIRELPVYQTDGACTTIPLEFAGSESYFVVFPQVGNRNVNPTAGVESPINFSQSEVIKTIDGPWTVEFGKAAGGPGEIIFPKLMDWTAHETFGVKYYSGIATYRKLLRMESLPTSGSRVLLDVGEVNAMARVRLNGREAGVVWTSPGQVDITALVMEGDNNLEIEVANLWPNRLIGDEQLPYDGPENNEWPWWMKNGKERTSGRVGFTTYKYYKKDSPLLKSGLLGPVRLLEKPL